MNQHTIFDTPIVAPICRVLAKFLLFIAGWKRGEDAPKLDKYVLIAAPHTSNWDFYFTLLAAFDYRVKIFWMGKDSLFKGAAGPIMRWLGGISVDRSSSNNLVDQTIEAFKKNDKLIVTVPPEGTRGKVSYWKSGFYHIAMGAGVPIVLGYVDFGRKIAGLGPVFHPTGDFEKDLVEIKKFYKPIKGKYSHLFSEDAVKSRTQSEDNKDQ